MINSLPRAASGLTLALLAAAVAPAQEAPSREAPSPEAQAEDARSTKARRILHLAGGTTLRSLCYFDGQSWQVRRQGNWVQVDPRAVHHWRAEAEVERQARQLRKKLGPKDHGQRVELADWLVREGLVEEALEEVERVLHLQPDFPAALELLRTAQLPRPSGGNAEAEPVAVARRLVAAGTSAGPVDRELLILALGELQRTDRGEEVLRSTLRRELRMPRVLQRTFAAHALRRLMPGEELYELMRRCVLDTSSPVREEAARALTATGEPGIVVPLVRALGSESQAIRTNAAESLGNAGFTSAVPALVRHFASLPQASGPGVAKTAAHIEISTHFAYVGDFDLEIAQGASIADPVVFQGAEAKILDVRVGGVSGYTYVREYRSIHGSLEQLTGANPGSSPADWQDWYEENRASFEGPESGPPR